MSRLTDFLAADVTREQAVDKQVDARVARTLAWYIALHDDGTAADDLASYAVFMDGLGINSEAEKSASGFVQSALAFLRDEHRHREIFERVMNGATVKEATNSTKRIA